MNYIKNTTQKAEQMLHSYNFYKGKNNGENLSSIYANFSKAKYKASQYCQNHKKELGGWGACFGGHNSYFFTYMFLFKKKGKTYLAYITHANDYAVEVEGA